MIPWDIKRLFNEHGTEMILETGDVLFSQGDASNAVYYVMSGSLTVYASEGNANPILLNNIEAGELVGELGAITRHPRSATLIADSHVVLSCIPTIQFRSLLADTLSLVETMTSTNREHLISADMARIQFGHTYQQMQKRLDSLGDEKEQLQELLRLREELEAMVVHDLRNPLNAVMIALSLLERMKDQVKDPDAFIRIMGHANSATQRMKQMISTLLDIARLKAGKLVLNIREFDLSMLLKDIIEMEKTMTTGAIEIITQTLPGLMVKADRDVLGRVVANLLDNAVKYAPPSSKIEITAHLQDNQTIRIIVTDAGPGVPLEERERIFDKFTRVKGAEYEKRSGTGLGLTFCRMAVEAHGGAIWVDAGPSGVGSCFTVQIPQG
jgi:signal transduction histidine kinase